MQQNLPHILNLGNSIIGVTVLAMPFCFQECGIILGIILLLFCTWLTLVSCQLLMKAGITSRKRSYGFLAQYTHGAPGKLAVEVGMIGLQLGTLIAQVVIIGDLGPAIVSKWTGYENSNNLRTALIIILCLCVGLPLGLLRDLHTVSTASTGCICFYSFFVFYVMTLSSQNLRAGNWVEKVNMWRTDGLFKCLPIFSFAFGCQTQLFILFDVLPEPSLKGINSIVRSAVNMCTVAYLLVGFFGYIAFCDVEIGGDIITQFSETHMSDILKIGFVLSIAVTFPLIIFPCRSSLYTLLFSPKPKQEDIEARPVIPEVHFKAITITIVLVSMITGILVPNVEFVLAMNGATMGTLICYIFPAMFFLRVMTGSSEGKNRAQLVFVFGVTIMLLCTYTTLNSQEHVQPKTRETLGIKSGKGTLPVDKSALLKQPIEVQGNVPILEKDKDKIPPDKSKEKRDEGIIDDKRIEPPNPKPPDDEQKNGSNLEKNDEKAVDKKSELENTKDVEKSKSGKKRKHKTSKDSKVKDLEKSQNEEIKEQEDLSVMEKEEEKVPEKDIIEKKEEIKEEKDVNGKKDEEKEEKYVDEKKEDKVQDEKESALDAKKQKELIAKLEKQQIEQKKLIEEQKEILKELKEHKIQEHDNVDKIQGNVEQEKRDDTHQNVEGQQVNVGGQQVNAGGQQVNMGGQVNMGDQQANVGGQVNIGGQQANVGGQQLYAGGQQQKLIQQQQQPLGVQQQQQPLGGVAQQQQPLGGVQQQQQQQPLGGVAQQQQPLGGVQQQQQPLGGVAQQQQPLGGVQQQQPLGGVQQQQQPLGGVQQQQQPLGGVQQQQQQLGGVQQQQAFGGQQQLGGGQQQLEGGQQKHIPVKRDVSGQQEQQVLGDQQQLGGRQQLPQQLGDEFQEFKAAIISGRQQQQDGGIHNIQSKDGTGEKDGTVDGIKSPNSQQKLQGQQNNDNAPKQQPPVEKKEQQQQEPPVAQNMEQNPKEKKSKAKPEKTVSKDRNDKKKEDKDKEKSVNDEMRRKKLSIDEINDDTLYVQKAADQLLVGGTPGQLASGVLRSLKSVHEDK